MVLGGLSARLGDPATERSGGGTDFRGADARTGGLRRWRAGL